MTTRVTIVKLPPDLVASGVNLPEVDPGSYVLVDNDAKVCRTITDDDLAVASVDNNIATFRLLDINWLTLDIDNQTLSITYTDGRTANVVLGSINYNSAPVRSQEFGQTDGVIYPIDEEGNPLLDLSNTPNLAAIHVWYWREAKRVNDEHLQMAELVHAFTEDIAHLAETSHAVGEITGDGGN
jgi:hypothetical protein